MTNDVKMNAAPTAPAKKKRRKIASLERRKARAGWIFVLPFIIGFVVIYLPMIVQSIQLSFSEIKFGGGGAYELTNIGFKNYSAALFTDPGYVQQLLSGLASLAFDIPAILIFSLFMAIMLNQKMAGRGAFRSIFFVPVVISVGVIETQLANRAIQSMMEGGVDLGETEGLNGSGDLVSSMDLQMLFANMKVGTELVDYIVGIINNIYDIVNRSGVQMLIFLSALQSISPAIYESCKIDGATGWETFWKITFPMISPMILVNGVYTVIDSFTAKSNTVMQYIDKVYNGGSTALAPEQAQHVATSMYWIYFLIVMLLVALIAAIFSAFVFYQRKND